MNITGITECPTSVAKPSMGDPAGQRIAITQSVILSVTPTGCTTCEPRFAAWMRVRSESASAAARISMRSALLQSRGLHSVLSAKRLPITSRKRPRARSAPRFSWWPEKPPEWFCPRAIEFQRHRGTIVRHTLATPNRAAPPTSFPPLPITEHALFAVCGNLST